MGQRENEAEDVVYSALIRDVRLAPVLLASTAGTLGTNIASPALPAIAEALVVSDSRIGLVISVYSLMAMIAVPFTGVIADMFGRRTVLLPSLVVYGLAGAAIAFVGTFEAILLLRAIQGLAYAAIMPISVTLLGDLYTGATGSAAQGIRVGTNGFSNTVTPILAGFLAGIAWTVPFLMFLLCLPIMLVAYRYLPETTSTDSAGTGFVETARQYVLAIRDEVTDLDMGVLLFGEFVRDVIRFGLITFVPLFVVRDLNASLVIAGTVLSIRGVLSMAVGPLSGSVVAFFSRKWALVGGLLLSAGAVAAVPLSPNVVILGALIGVYTIGDATFSPVIKDAVATMAGDEQRGGIISGMNMLKYAGQTIAPAVFGIVLAVSGFDWLFWTAALVGLGYALVLVATITADI